MEETKTTTFMDKLKGMVNSFGLPRLIIAAFLLVLVAVDMFRKKKDIFFQIEAAVIMVVLLLRVLLIR